MTDRRSADTDDGGQSPDGADRSSLSRGEFNELLTFDGEVQGLPTRLDLVVRDDDDLLIYANRRKNADGEWEICSYRILGDGVAFTASEVDRATVAAILVEEFAPDALTTDERYSSQRPVRHGVPVAVAVDGRPAIAAWLYARQGRDREEIAELLDIADATVPGYLSRFRRRGTGIPDDRDVPAVGATVPEVPAAFDPAVDLRRFVEDGGERS